MKTTTIVFTVIGILLCCICALTLVPIGAGLLVYLVPVSSGPVSVTAGPGPATPFPIAPSNTPAPAIHDPGPILTDTLQTLALAEIPENDPADLAVRLGGVPGPIPETVPAPAVPFAPGDQKFFWATNTDTSRSFRIEATLQYLTEHTYFWVQDGVDFNLTDLRALADDFDQHTYPTVREFFGSEWSPGIDNDPRIHILYARGLGRGLAGYFSSADVVHPLAHEYSNAHEMFFLSADNVDLDELFTYGVLAHEFQHMIHWNIDRNEETWMNEGFAELAALLTGYYDGGFDRSYARQPDIQLNTWPDDGDTIPHYGGAFLFLAYFLDRFGEDATMALARHPANGFESIDQQLAESAGIDPLRGRIPDGNDLFQDFAAALVLMDPSVGDGRYDFSIYPDAPQVSPTETFSRCPSGQQARDVNQFGIDVIRISCAGSYTLSFDGSASVPLLPQSAFSGDYAFWSNRGDEADMTLTRLFDFSEIAGGDLTLAYQVWFDVEKDYDYVYLLASLDGETWQILETPGGTADNPSGNSFGWAYNGSSSGWVREMVDISQFAGQQVWLRFEYITDAAVNGEGLLLDDIAVPEIGYFTDFEVDAGGWEAAGFARIRNELPQTYKLTLISSGAGGTQVEYLELDAANSLEISIVIGQGVDEVVLIVSGTTPFTRQPSGYTFEIH